MEQDTPTAASPIRWPAWIALGATVLIGLSMLLPWTQLRGRSITGLDLIRQSEDLLGQLDLARRGRSAQQERREQIDETLPPRRDGPLARRLAPEARQRPLVDRVEQAREQVKEYAELTERILAYVRIGAIAILVVALLPVAWVLLPFKGVRATCGTACGLVGFALLGTLLLLTWYLSGLELFGKSLPLLAGWWSLVAGTLVLAIPAGVWAACTNWRLFLPIELLPAVAWCAWFGRILELW